MPVNVAINRATFLNEAVCESHQVWAVLPQGTAWLGQGSKVSLLDQNKEFSSHCCHTAAYAHNAWVMSTLMVNSFTQLKAPVALYTNATNTNLN